MSLAFALLQLDSSPLPGDSVHPASIYRDISNVYTLCIVVGCPFDSGSGESSTGTLMRDRHVCPRAKRSNSTILRFCHPTHFTFLRVAVVSSSNDSCTAPSEATIKLFKGLFNPEGSPEVNALDIYDEETRTFIG